jgi:hypothetical protein
MHNVSKDTKRGCSKVWPSAVMCDPGQQCALRNGRGCGVAWSLALSGTTDISFGTEQQLCVSLLSGRGYYLRLSPCSCQMCLGWEAPLPCSAPPIHHPHLVRSCPPVKSFLLYLFTYASPVRYPWASLHIPFNCLDPQPLRNPLIVSTYIPHTFHCAARNANVAVLLALTLTFRLRWNQRLQ